MEGVRLCVNNHLIDDVRLAIFDKDGTLIDAHAYWANMVKWRADIIAERLALDKKTKIGIMESMGVNSRCMQIKPEGPVGLKKREIVMQSAIDYLLSLGLPDHTKLFKDVFLLVDKLSLERFDEIIQPLKGLYALIDGLKAGGNCKIALATTDRSDRAALAMKHLGLFDTIDFIAGADNVRQPKPSREIIDVICTSLAVPVERSIMVGDSRSDVMTGINAGCLASIGVASGLTPVSELETLTDYVTDNISKMEVVE